MGVFVSLVTNFDPMGGRRRLISLKLGNLRAELSPGGGFSLCVSYDRPSSFVETHPVSPMPAPAFADVLVPAPFLVGGGRACAAAAPGALLAGRGYAPQVLVCALSSSQAHRCLDAEPVVVAHHGAREGRWRGKLA